MPWIMSQNGQILIDANLIKLENDNTITANGITVGKFDLTGDVLMEMTLIEKWLDRGGAGIYRISQA